MKLMLKKNVLDELMSFVDKEANNLGLEGIELEAVGIEIAANLRFTFPCETRQLELIRRITRNVASQLNFSDQELDDISLAIDEASTNVIKHSYHEGKEGPIRIDLDLDDYQLTIKVIDAGEKGQRFNPGLLQDVINQEKYLQTLQRGGLGVLLIKKIMDRVEYTVSPGVFNCLTMVKYVKKK